MEHRHRPEPSRLTNRSGGGQRPVGDDAVSGGQAEKPTPQDFFAGHPRGLEMFEAVRSMIGGLGHLEVTTSKSQVAFRRRRGFAFLWMPGQYLAKPDAEVVLSIALGRRDPSPRFKEVVQVAPSHWMHHLEIHDLGDIDAEVEQWLREAAERAE
jgi:hypothetical protein